MDNSSFELNPSSFLSAPLVANNQNKKYNTKCIYSSCGSIRNRGELVEGSSNSCCIQDLSHRCLQLPGERPTFSGVVRSCWKAVSSQGLKFAGKE